MFDLKKKRNCTLSKLQKQRCCEAAPLFLHMQNIGFLMTWLILFHALLEYELKSEHAFTAVLLRCS